METIVVYVHPDDKKVNAYRYASTCILVLQSKVCNTDQSIVTDSDGYRYKKKTSEYPGSMYAEYKMI